MHLQRWSLLFAVLTGAWIGAPAEARASCGDYVVIGQKAGDYDSRHSPAPAPVPTPCHSPSCSGDPTPAMPAPPAPVPTGPHADEFGCLSTHADGPAPAHGSWWFGTDPANPAARVTSIFHPPRL
jgi:hypothetical protein